MTDFRSLYGATRLPTFADRVRVEELRAAGVEDVYSEPDDAPDEFWVNIVQAATRLLAPADSPIWQHWEAEMTYACGWAQLFGRPYDEFRSIVAEGYRRTGNRYSIAVAFPIRLAAVEHLLDLAVVDDDGGFADRVNERARWYRVGLRLDGRRFVPITSEHMHTEVVLPTLLLLAQPQFAAVDALYRKAFERSLSGDSSGAITAATTAVEEMLRAGLGVTGMAMDALATRAKDEGWLLPATREFAVKLYALRMESDAHTVGTDSPEVAMLAIHLAGSLLLHLGVTGPFAA